MSTIVRMAQGSPEWHEHRRKCRNASETPTVLGVSLWQTPYQLWQLKLGLVEQEITPAMRHGSELEAPARAAYERRSGLVMQPLVVVDGDYSASLDGMTLSGDRIVEIKCPVNSRESALWRAVEASELPEHYRWQVQHQLMVSKAEVADVFVFDGSEGILLEVAREPSTWPAIHEAWSRFWEFLVAKTPPPLSKGDVREREDPEWIRAATQYLEAKKLCDEAAENLEAAKKTLVGLATHSSEKGAGVAFTKYWRRGNVDYSKVPALQTIDLEPFRSPARMDVRITVTNP